MRRTQKGTPLITGLGEHWIRLLTHLSFAALFGLVLSACAPDFEDEPDPGNTQKQQGGTIVTLPSDQGPTTEGIVAVEVTDVDGNKFRTLADAKKVLVRFNDRATNRQKKNIMSAASVRAGKSLPFVPGLTQTQISAGQSLESAIATLNSDLSVEYAEPDYILTSRGIPNDSRFSTQWALNNRGQTGGTPDADIDAPEAWDLHTGNNVVIAVIDTGVDYNHPDLAANIWTNTGEIPNNGRDDDGNGYVDDVRGWDFANDDNDPVDDHNHGTHVAGIIAAEGNNGSGVAGVNWSARIMPLKFMTATGQGSTFAAIQAIEYAVANGARVSNNSWGGPGFSRALYDAIAAARDADHTFVAAAGNSGRNNDSRPEYPASFNLSNIISVAATDSRDQRAGFSNYGARTVDLGAPGVGILSTIRNNNYRAYSGTSMAAPFVAGAAGLLLAAQPGLTTSAVKSALLDTVDPKASLGGRTVSEGRLNLFAALSQVMAGSTVVTVTVNPLTATLTAGDSLLFNASGGAVPYTWSVNNSSVASVSSTGRLSAIAAGNVVVTARDANGNTGMTGAVQITALAAQADPLVISPMNASPGVGQTIQFTAIGGVTPFSWSSSNPGVASINATTGLLTALSTGSFRVSLIDNTGTSASSNLITITQLGITPAIGVLPVGRTIQLTPTGGTPPYTWRSSNANVLQVSTSGLLTTRATGTAMITVTDAGGSSANTGNVVVRSVSVVPVTATLQPADTLQFTVSGGAAPYRWSVSNASVANITSTGRLTALAAGSVTVTATDADGLSASSGAVSVGSSSINAQITITPGTANVPITGWKRFMASGGTPPYTWTLSNSSAGIINSTTWPGWFLASGSVGSTTTILVRDSQNNPGESGVVTVTGQ